MAIYPVDRVQGVAAAIAAHLADLANPHAVSKTQVGLGNVDNTSDASKPVSTEQQAALDLKANLAGSTFTGDVSVPDEVYGAPWNGSFEVPTKNALYDKIETIAADAMQAVGTLTITAGVITLPTITPGTAVIYGQVDTEGGAATDDLTAIAVTGTVANGTILVLRPVADARDVTIVDGAGIRLANNISFAMLTGEHVIAFVRISSTIWQELYRTPIGSGTASVGTYLRGDRVWADTVPAIVDARERDEFVGTTSRLLFPADADRQSGVIQVRTGAAIYISPTSPATLDGFHLPIGAIFEYDLAAALYGISAAGESELRMWEDLLAVRATLWTPLAVPHKLKAWFRANAIAGPPANGADVPTWTDQSGLGNNAVNTTGTDIPTFVAVGPAVQFTAADLEFYDVAGVSASSVDESWGAVINVTDLAVGRSLVSTNAGAGRLTRIKTDGKLEVSSLATTTIGTGTISVPTGALAMVGGTLRPTVWRLGVNGTVEQGGHAVTFTAGRTTRFGRGSGSEYFSGQVREWAIFQPALSLSEEAQWQGYIAHTHGLTANLPASHPYKTTPPLV